MSISLPNYTKNTLMILFFFIVVCCNEKVDNNDKYIIDRFEKQFYNSKPIELNELKKKYPYFFPKSFPESVWVERLGNPIQQEIFNEIQNEYESVKFLELELSGFFNKNLEINKNFIKPKAITVNTDIDYRNKIILADSILLIGLDNYLGSNHRFYREIPLYLKEDLTSLNIISDIAEQFAIDIVPRIEFYTFLDKIIYFGKILYYKDFCLNIEDRLNQFVFDAPFSKFYLEVDNESSEKIGKYIGWQIVKSYMKNNDISLTELLKTSPTDIYNKSKYKPNK